MKKLILATITSIMLLSSLVFTGCNTTGAPTQEAVIFYTYADTWNVAYVAYKAHCERVVQGKVSKADEALMDSLWNTFRVTFKTNLTIASQNWNAVAPAEVKQQAAAIHDFNQ